MTQIYTNKDTDRKLDEMKKNSPNFNASEEFRKHIDEIYNEIGSENLETLRKKHLDILEREKQIAKEKKLNEEKIREAELKEPERKRIEEKRRQREIREYETRFSNGLKLLLDTFKINRKEAEDIVKEYLSSPELQKKGIGITELAIKDGYKLNLDTLSKARDDAEVYNTYAELGYKF